jgi:integrase
VAVSPAQKSEVKHRVSMLVALRSAPDRGDDLRPGRVRHGTPGERVSGAHRLLVRLAHAGREVLQMHVLAVTACSRSATARRCQGTRYATGSSAPRGEQASQATGNVHILRHTFCSHLAMRGAPAKAIQDLAGHQHRSTTMRYMHLSPSERERERAIGLLNGRGAHGTIAAHGGAASRIYLE